MNQLICDKVINKLHYKEYWQVLYIIDIEDTFNGLLVEYGFIQSFIHSEKFEDEKSALDFMKEFEEAVNNHKRNHSLYGYDIDYSIKLKKITIKKKKTLNERLDKVKIVLKYL